MVFVDGDAARVSILGFGLLTKCFAGLLVVTCEGRLTWMYKAAGALGGSCHI